MHRAWLSTEPSPLLTSLPSVPLTRVYRNRNTIPPPSSSFAGSNSPPLSIPPSNVPSRFLQPPPPRHRQHHHHHPFAPVVITSIHFTLKAAGVVPLRPETSPARVAFSLRIATRPLPSAPNHRVLVPLADEVQTPFPNSRAITGGDDSVQTRAKFGPPPNFCPCRQPPNAVFHREAKILMTLPAGGSAAIHVDG